MNVTLLDAVKAMSPGAEQAILMIYALSTHVTMKLPMKTVPGGTDTFTIVDELPHSGSSSYRNFGADYTATKVKKAKYYSDAKITGGRVQMDRVLFTMNPQEALLQQESQIAAVALNTTKDIFEGPGGGQIYGINSLIGNADMPYAAQSVDAGSAVLSPDIMDEALALHNVIPGQTYIYAGNAPYRSLKKQSRGNVATSYNINYAPEEYGTFSGIYDNIPVVKAMDEAGTDWFAIPSDTSVYIVTYGMENLYGHQIHPMKIHNLDGISVNQAFDIEWPINIVAKNPKCITRIINVKNAIV